MTFVFQELIREAGPAEVFSTAGTFHVQKPNEAFEVGQLGHSTVNRRVTFRSMTSWQQLNCQ